MPVPHRRPHPLYAIGTNTPEKVAEAGRRGQKVHLGPFDPGGAGRLTVLCRSAMVAGGHFAELIKDNLRWLIHTKIILVGKTDDEAWDVAERLFTGPMVMAPWIRRDPAQDGWSLRKIYRADPGPFAPAMGGPESQSAFLRRTAIVGGPDAVAAELAAYRDAGLRHVHARFIFGGLDDPDTYRRSFRLFTEEVMPGLGVDTIPAPTGDQVRAS